METWDKLPLDLMDDLAEREKYRVDIYRPIYSMHKWWARRPGSTFRCLGLAALTDDDVTKDDILSMNESGTRYTGQYLQAQGDEFSDEVVLDPFAGGGTTLFELNRLGANVIGYELNPVAWWTNKKTLEDVDPDRIKKAADNVLDAVRDEIGQLYTTTDPDTGQDSEILYSFQTQRIPCLTCDETVNLFKNYKIQRKKKTQDAIVYCPNDQCKDRFITLEQEIPDELTCPACSHTFDPSEGNTTRSKYTCSNGHTHDIKETLQRRDLKPTFDYYAIQYLNSKGERAIKPFTEDDRETVKEAQSVLDDRFDELPIPTQPIPSGDKTSRLTTRGFETYDDLFTDRQLLTYALLFKRARNVEDQKIGEFLITAISNSLGRGSNLARWDDTYNIAAHVFSRQSYVPRVEPVEGNPLNTDENIVAVENYLNTVVEAKRYCCEPFEKMKESGEVNQYYVQNESTSEDRVKQLACKTSERLELEDESVDYIITDPPYYDNVQYSELSGYYYSWLHHVLADEYDEFEPEHVPNAREIVANSRTGKDEDFFVKSLSNVFSECHRVLADDGELMFTYHHNENEAWSVILNALIDSGFTITGAYPVQSEMPGSMVISELENAEYDILIFATKESVNESISLQQLREDLFFELQDMVAEEQERHQNLSQADLGVILRGKCLYYYSRHYPDVYANGEQVGVDHVLNTVDDVIEQVVKGSISLPPGIDTMTKAYAAFLQRAPEPKDDLNKQLLAKNLNVSDFEDEKLVKDDGEMKAPVPADERVHHIERKLNRSGNDAQQTLEGGHTEADTLLDIDKVQYLYHLYTTDQDTSNYLSEWKSSDLKELAEFLADATGDDRYESVMQMNLSQF